MKAIQRIASQQIRPSRASERNPMWYQVGWGSHLRRAHKTLVILDSIPIEKDEDCLWMFERLTIVRKLRPGCSKALGERIADDFAPMGGWISQVTVSVKLYDCNLSDHSRSSERAGNRCESLDEITFKIKLSSRKENTRLWLEINSVVNLLDCYIDSMEVNMLGGCQAAKPNWVIVPQSSGQHTFPTSILWATFVKPYHTNQSRREDVIAPLPGSKDLLHIPNALQRWDSSQCINGSSGSFELYFTESLDPVKVKIYRNCISQVHSQSLISVQSPD